MCLNIQTLHILPDFSPVIFSGIQVMDCGLSVSEQALKRVQNSRISFNIIVNSLDAGEASIMKR